MDVLLHSRGVDWAIAALAARQQNMVGRDQLLAIGVGRGAIDHRRRCGRLHLFYPGVYAVGSPTPTAAGRLMAAVLVGGAGAVASHRSAAALWAIRPTSRRQAEITTPIKRRSRAEIRFYHSALPADEVTVRDGIPVTSPARTILDLALVLDRQRLEAAINEAEYQRLPDRVSLPELLSRYPRRRGTARLRAIVGAGQPRRPKTRSELELDFLALVREHGLPEPEVNAVLHAAGRRIEADFVWRKQRLIVELDGRAAHGTRRAFERDRARDRALAVAGWRTVRLTWLQVQNDRRGIARDLLSLLAMD